GRTAAKVCVRHDDSSLFHFFDKILVDIFHAVRRQLRRIRRIEITSRNDNVRIHVVSIFEYCSIRFHIFCPPINLTLTVRKFFRLPHWLPPPPDSPGILLISHGPFFPQSFCLWWRYSVLPPPGYPYSRPGR